MVKRSLQACPSRVHQARRAFALKGWTQENLAGEVNLKTRQPIWRFFTGQPVERQIFVEICAILDLDWREMAIDPPAEFPEVGKFPATHLDLDGLVQQVRAQRWDTVRDQCGILQLFEVSRPVSIEDIYVDVNILEEIASQQWCELADLQHPRPVQLDRVEGAIEQRQIPGIQAVETYSKLKVLGKPGVGKTIFLKHLAIQCNRGEFASDRVPISIALSDFAAELRDRGKFGLREYIGQEFVNSGIANTSVLETLLQAGRVLLLIDGMDEVRERDMTSVLRELRKFLEKYHKNQFVVTCRTAASNFQLRGFTEVEIAPFTQTQIATFAHKWFTAFAITSSPQSAREQSIQLLQDLDLPENWRLRQLVATPLFLHLVCKLFQAQTRFPTKLNEFYEQALNLLLGRWDEAKGIDRDDIGRGFLLPQKLRLLSQLATVTFEQGQYLFDRRAIERYIGDYLRNLPDTNLEPEELQIESSAILKAIETQHGLLAEQARGIFSFSALAFQEYFTARKIAIDDDLVSLERSLRGLVGHLTDARWREVFLITAAMLQNADGLVQLMKQQIDLLVDREPALQDFLVWVSQTLPLNLARSKNQLAWVQQLRNAIADYQNTHPSWQCNPDREQLLQSYCYANQLLLDCLNGNSAVSTAIRQEIEATLLLPQRVGSITNMPWIPTLISPLRSPQSA